MPLSYHPKRDPLGWDYDPDFEPGDTDDEGEDPDEDE